MADPPNHFFMFVPKNSKFNLSIPESVLTKLDGWRCKRAILRRGHHEWLVHIGDGGVFGDRWRKFVIENGVHESDLIVFKHQGNMMFNFFVFDPFGCGRQYPNLGDEMEQSLSESDSLHTHKKSKMVDTRMSIDGSSQSKDETRLNDDHCFVTMMTPYCIRKTRLYVPLKFARSNGLTTQAMHTQIVLVDQAKRTCPATLHNMTYEIRLTGWRDLKIQNDLQVGDECMFELVKAGEVPIFNFYNLGKKPNTHNNIQVKKETSLTIPTSTNSTRYFISTLKPSNCERSCLYLPVDFLRRNDLRTGEMILQDDKGRSWNVQLKKHGKKNRFYIGCGFRDFLTANGLMEGDVYKFELVENQKDKPPVVNFLLYLDRTPPGKEDHPNFIGKVESYMYLPKEFAKANGLLNKEEMILKSARRSWTVDIKRTRDFCYIGQEWKEFCGANGMKEGDVFKLELIINDEIPIANIYVSNVH